MLETLPDLSRRWHDRIGFPLAVGIGINTGQAQVGNAGSQRRMKYGPLGPTVNLASRTEGATKFFQVPLLVTGAVVDQLSDRRRTRRLATVRVVGIDAPVPLYEYWTGELSDHWLARREAYQTALELLEQHQAEMAQEVVMLALQDTRSTSDLPLRQLNQRIASVLANAADTYETVVQLASK